VRWKFFLGSVGTLRKLQNGELYRRRNPCSDEQEEEHP
jgi:hypothetical protein